MDQTSRDHDAGREDPGDLSQRLQAELDQARADVLARDYAAARAGLDGVAATMDGGALAGGEDARLRVQYQLALATVVGEAYGQQDQALELVMEAQALVDDHGLTDLRARVLAQRSFVHQRRGESREALGQLEQAEELLGTCAPRDALQMLVNRGVLQAEIGSLEAAVEDFTRAERMAADNDQARLRSMAIHNLGWVAFLRGDLPAALESMHAAAVVPGVAGEGSIGALDRARVLTEAGLLDAADGLLAGAIANLADGSRRQDEGEARLARARVAMVMGALDDALEEARGATACFAAVGSPPWLRRAEMTRLAAMVETIDAHDVADVPDDFDDPDDDPVPVLRTHLDQLLAQARAAGDDQVVIAVRLMAAEMAMVAPDVASARRHFAAVVLDEVRGISLRMRWHRVGALLAARDGTGARRAVSRGMAELAEQQAQLGSLDLRTAVAIHGRDLAGIAIDVALDTMDPEAIHAAVEQAHASSSRMPPVRAALDGTDQDVLSHLRRATVALDMAEHDDGVQRAQRIRLQEEVDALRARVRERAWHRGGSDPSREIVDLSTLQEALACRGAVALTWARRAGRLRAVVLDGSELDVVDVGPADDIDEHVARLHSDLRALLLPGVPDLVRTSMQSSLRAGLEIFDEQYLHSLDGIAGRDLVMVPSGSLALVPWPLVPSRRGLATTMAPCLTAWSASQDRPVRTDADVVAIAGPGLVRADAETSAVAATWPNGVSWAGSGATIERTRTALQSASLVHLAMHGRHRESSPLFSSLDLFDGPMFAHELTDRVVSDLVVVSACEVGASHLRPGDEPLGMTAALHHAGAATVIAGVAPVHDSVAHDVMVDLHRDLAAGTSPAAALGAVSQVAWETGDPAPFTCVGAGLVPVVGAGDRSSDGPNGTRDPESG